MLSLVLRYRLDYVLALRASSFKDLPPENSPTSVRSHGAIASHPWEGYWQEDVPDEKQIPKGYHDFK